MVEGSIPDETNKKEGYWATFGTDPQSGQPIPHYAIGSTVWPRKPGPWWRREPAPPTAAFTPWREIRPVAGAFPITWDGIGNRTAGIPLVCIPGCPVQPDNMTQSIAGIAVHRRRPRADDRSWTMRCVPNRFSAKRSTKAATAVVIMSRRNSARIYGSRAVHREVGLLGTRWCNATWESGAGWEESAAVRTWAASASAAPCPGFPDKFMPFMDQPPGSLLSSKRGDDLWPSDSRAAPLHAGVAQSRAELAFQTRTEPNGVVLMAGAVTPPEAEAILAELASVFFRDSAPSGSRGRGRAFAEC